MPLPAYTLETAEAPTDVSGIRVRPAPDLGPELRRLRRQARARRALGGLVAFGLAAQVPALAWLALVA